MKKLSMICMAALLVMAMSCKKNENENNADGKGFRASMEAPTGDSKTHLENDGIVKWDAGDAIRVVNGASPVAAYRDFTTDAVVGDDNCVVFRSESVEESFFMPGFKAYYPASIYNHTTGKVTLPATQTYVKTNGYDSFGIGCNPMVAQSNDTKLHFKHLCGILALQLKGTCKVASIKLTAKGGEQLCGVGMVDFSGDRPTFAFDGTSKTDGNNSITLTCGDVQLNTTTATTFYFVIPAVTLSTGIDVKLTDTDNNVWERSASLVTSISQQTISTMAVLSIETHNPNFPIGAIPGEFTINNSGGKVCFSCGNLQYRAKGGIGGDACTEAEEANIQPGQSIGGTWRFAEHQWDIVGSQKAGDQNFGNVYVNGVLCDNEDAARDYEGWVDLFGWGCNGIKHDNSGLYSSSTPYRDLYYLYYRPWDMDYHNIDSDKTNNDGYGPSTTNGDGNLRLENGADWGVNPIINGGNQPKQWRTLTKDEWTYVMKTRKVGQNNDKKAYTFVWLKVDPNDANKNVYGILLFYDGYTGTIPTVNTKIDAIPEGCVFLPAAGNRDKPNATITCGNMNHYCAYYSATKYNYIQAYKVWMTSGYEYTNSQTNRPMACAVRLVQDLPKQTP